VTACLVALFLVGPGTVELDLERGGERAGTVTMEQRVLEDGRKLSVVRFRSEPPGVEVVQESTYGPDGRPLRMLQATVAAGSRTTRSATFDDAGAEFLGPDGAAKRVPLPEGADSASPSEFWFLRDRPIVGEAVRFYRFDLAAGAWRESSATFLGEREIVVRGHLRRAFRTRVEGVVSDVDESGLPWRVELADGSVLLRR
jgi:hypothetical protein